MDGFRKDDGHEAPRPHFDNTDDDRTEANREWWLIAASICFAIHMLVFAALVLFCWRK